MSVGLVAAIVVALSAPLQAQDRGAFDDTWLSQYTAATARMPGKTFFNADTPDCAVARPVCRTKAYVVGGDPILIAERRNGFVATIFVDRRGRSTRGWLPQAAVMVSRGAGAIDWTGHWRREEADIRIVRSRRAGRVTLAGSALYGSLDPVRVANGSVNMGEFDGAAVPRGDRIFYRASADDCRVTLRQVGDYLVVMDNQRCGGLNVTFMGFYRRQLSQSGVV